MLQEEEVVAGKHSVTEALKSGRTINKIWIAENAQKHLTLPIIAEAKKLGIVIQHVDKRKLDQMVPGVQHQGVVAQAAPYAYVEVEDLLKVAEEKANRLSCASRRDRGSAQSGLDSPDGRLHGCSWRHTA